jgi:uncharacterized membrane protein HdeD (DUF308 family)
MSLDRTVATSLRDHWGLFLAEGIVLLVLGAGAVALPVIALALAVFLGWLLIVTGLVGLFTTLGMRHAPGFWSSLLSVAAALGAGFLLIGWPLPVELSLSGVLVFFFAVEGIACILFAVEHKRAMSGRWVWMLACGLVDLGLGGLVLAGDAGTSGRMTGVLVGISMVFGGVSLVAMGLDARAIKA